MPSVHLNNVLDGSGNGLHLTVGGLQAPTIASNPFSISQDGMTFGGGQVLGAWGADWNLINGDYTYEFRFKRDTSKNGTVQVIFGRWGGSSRFQFLCYFDSDNGLKFLSQNGSALASSAITDGSAHTAAIVRSGAQYSLYVDGTRVSGPSNINTYPTVPDDVPFQVGDYDDISFGASGGLPFWGTLGDFRWSNTARYTGSSYTPSSSPLASDANTLALLPMASLAGNYLGPATYQGNALVRTGYSQASGGWANPDGPLPTQDGKFYFTASAFNGTLWTVYAKVADTLSDLLTSGSGTVQGTAIQTPSGGDIAANGSVVYFGGTYHHYYQNSALDILHSTGSSLNAAFSSGTVLFAGFDAWVRPKPGDPATLEMYFVRGGGVSKQFFYATSTDGSTWTTPVEIISETRQGGFGGNYPGEPTVAPFPASGTWMLSDAAPGTGSTGRRLLLWGSKDGTNWFPLKQLVLPAGSGYVSCYDASFYYDAANQRFVVLAANSTTTEPTQPTDSDIGVWFVPINGTIAATRRRVQRFSMSGMF